MLNNEPDLTIRIGGGGLGSGGVYVVHLTEQEAFGIIRIQLEAVGLVFGDEPPEYRAGGRGQFNLNLFDENRGVVVSHLTWGQGHQALSSIGRNFVRAIEAEFAEQTDYAVGVFYTPGMDPRRLNAYWGDTSRTASARAVRAGKAEARPILEANLTAQINDFISYLRTAGIIE